MHFRDALIRCNYDGAYSHVSHSLYVNWLRIATCWSTMFELSTMQWVSSDNFPYSWNATLVFTLVLR